MSEILVEGLHRLRGEIGIQGSKNAALPMMAAAVLHKGMTVLNNVPRIQDVFCMMGILKSIGCKCSLDGHTLTIDASEINQTQIPREFLTAMRSSVILMGVLLGRCREAQAGYPGGCTIGKRPIDLHLYALKEMGTQIRETDGELYARTEGLKGSEILFSYPSVGATEQAVLAAVLADGVTLIQGAAREPEIGNLCRLLNHIESDTLRIKGVNELKDTVYDIPGDRIVAGTYLYAVMAAGGEAVLRGICPAEPLDFFLPKDRGYEMKLLSQDNRRKLLSWLAGCRTNFELGLLLSLSTGIRVGELCGVKWEDVDLEEGVLHIRRTVSRIRNTDQKNTAAKTVLYIGSPKTGTSQREIPLPDFMIPRLKEKKREAGCYLLTGRTGCMEPRGVQRR